MSRVVVGLVAVLGVAGCSQASDGQDGPGPAAGTGQMLPAGMTAGERLGKADGFDPRDQYPEYYGFTAAPAGQVVLPGEFEPTSQMLLGWGSGADQLAPFFIELAVAASQSVPVTIYVPSQLDANAISQNLSVAGADMAAISFSQAELDSIWMRDYGPLVVRGETNDQLTAIDGRYYWGRWNDDYIPTAYANDEGLTVARPPLEIEGGNLLADGTGRCVTTEWLLEQNFNAFGYSQADVANILENYYGCDSTVFVPPLLGEGTGHVDMLVHVTGAGEAIVGDYQVAQDSSNSQRLDVAAARLEAAGWTVVRIPMPGNDGRTVFRSYTNALAVNDTVLVPIYDEDSAFEADALGVFAQAFPGRDIVSIDSDDIIAWSGAIHCVTMTVSP